MVRLIFAICLLLALRVEAAEKPANGSKTTEAAAAKEAAINEAKEAVTKEETKAKESAATIANEGKENPAGAKAPRKCLAFDIETGEQIGENRAEDYMTCSSKLRDAIKKEYCEPGLKKFSYNHQNGENKASKRTIYCN